MGFSIRSELASYARLKRRCYFLFVISYGVPTYFWASL